jgi:hypothetical protein
MRILQLISCGIHMIMGCGRGGPVVSAWRTGRRPVYGRDAAEDAEGPVIRLIGDARFSKVAVHRGAFDPMAPWRHWQDLRHAR